MSERPANEPELLESVWNRRDRPVLVAAARRLDGGASAFMSHELAAELGMPHEEVGRALRALTPTYLQGRAEGGLASTPDFIVIGLTERARREVGLWPSSDGVDALIDALRRAEDSTEDPEEKTLLRRAAGAVGSVSKDIMTDVIAAVVARQSGLG